MNKLNLHCETSTKIPRILARQLARELSKTELSAITGGQLPEEKSSSSSWSSSANGADDGGADD